jgi:hypothetical protein
LSKSATRSRSENGLHRKLTLEAGTLFDRLLARCNDVGLLAEEIAEEINVLTGQIPEAYCHVGVINCALNLGCKIGLAQHPMVEVAAKGVPRRHGRPPPCRPFGADRFRRPRLNECRHSALGVRAE